MVNSLRYILSGQTSQHYRGVTMARKININVKERSEAVKGMSKLAKKGCSCSGAGRCGVCKARAVLQRGRLK